VLLGPLPRLVRDGRARRGQRGWVGGRDGASEDGEVPLGSAVMIEAQSAREQAWSALTGTLLGR
jgi:hypothetical protein